jgi:hypothetical protein
MVVVGKQNIYIDLVEPFGYTGDGEFPKGVHQSYLSIRAEAATSARIIPSVSS